MNSVRDWCLPMGCVSICTCYWLDSPSVSAQSLHLSLLQIGHIWGERFVGEVVYLSLHWKAWLHSLKIKYPADRRIDRVMGLGEA